jgi:uncharacterized membrane protein YbaN (DUF454 family)
LKRIINLLFIAAGFAALGLGAVGAVIPVLPTTPFLFLACLCFARGSERFHKWFLGTWLYKKYLADFVKTRSMTLEAKLSLCIFVSALLAVPFVLFPYLALRIFIVSLLAIKWYYFMFRIKTLKSNNKNNNVKVK